MGQQGASDPAKAGGGPALQRHDELVVLIDHVANSRVLTVGSLTVVALKPLPDSGRRKAGGTAVAGALRQTWA